MLYTLLEAIIRIFSFLLGILTLPLLPIGAVLYAIGYLYMGVAMSISSSFHSADRRHRRSRRNPPNRDASTEGLLIFGPFYLASFIMGTPLLFFSLAGSKLPKSIGEKRASRKQQLPASSDSHQNNPWSDITNVFDSIDRSVLLAVLGAGVGCVLLVAGVWAYYIDINNNENGQITDGPLVGGEILEITSSDSSTTKTLIARSTAEPTPSPDCDLSAGCVPAIHYDFSGFAYIASIEMSHTAEEITPFRPLEITITWMPKPLEEENRIDYETLIVWRTDQGKKVKESRHIPQDAEGVQQPTSTWVPNQPVIDYHELSFDDYMASYETYVLYIGLIDPETNLLIPTKFGDMIPINPHESDTSN